MQSLTSLCAGDRSIVSQVMVRSLQVGGRAAWHCYRIFVSVECGGRWPIVLLPIPVLVSGEVPVNDGSEFHYQATPMDSRMPGGCLPRAWLSSRWKLTLFMLSLPAAPVCVSVLGNNR